MVFILVNFVLAGVNASAGQNLLEVWADIKVLGFDKAYIDDFFDVTDIYGEITLIGDYDDQNADQRKAISHLKQFSDQIKMGLACSKSRQQVIRRAFIQSTSSRPEKMHVKLSVKVDDQCRTLVSIVDHQLQAVSVSYFYTPGNEPADYIFTYCPRMADHNGVGMFCITDRKFFEKTGRIMDFPPPPAISELLKSLNMPENMKSYYEFAAGTLDQMSDDEETGTDILLSAGFQLHEGFDDL